MTRLFCLAAAAISWLGILACSRHRGMVQGPRRGGRGEGPRKATVLFPRTL
jgi:hypothetical protein